jgi:hypothetical protein
MAKKLDSDGHEPTFTLEPDRGVEQDVRDDIVEGLTDWFEPNPDGFLLCTDVHTHGRISNERVTAVVWRYEARPRAAVWGEATNDRRTLLVHGATFVDDAEGELRFSRFIDWHGVFADLGVAAAGRIVSEPD